MAKNYTIKEYDYLYKEDDVRIEDDKANPIPEKIFDNIEKFVLENKEDEDYNADEFLILQQKKGVGKILKAKNYVGIIETDSGTTIEILPKLYNSKNKYINEKEIRKSLTNMLCYLDKPNFKKFSRASLKIESMNIFDIFIEMFLDELSIIIKKGLKRGYINKKENLNYFKGKTIFSQHINRNYIHKEKVFAEYQEYSPNRPENKLIKSTLKYLAKKSNHNRLQKRIKQYMFVFDKVDYSKNYLLDFEKSETNRLMHDYQLILDWCMIFLTGKSFLNQKGENISFSLLFPMQQIFENYIAAKVKNSSFFKNYDVVEQDSKYLFDEPKKFKLKPDLVLENQDKSFIIDTKWKVLKEKNNLGIAGADMYQMFAYAKRYRADKVILLYPYAGFSKDFLKKSGKSLIFKSYAQNDNKEVTIQAHFIDLYNIDDDKSDFSLKSLYNILK